MAKKTQKSSTRFANYALETATAEILFMNTPIHYIFYHFLCLFSTLYLISL